MIATAVSDWGAAPLPGLPDVAATQATPAPQPSATQAVATVPSGDRGGSASTSGTDIVSLLLTGAVIAAVVGAFVNILLARRKSLEEERAHTRQVLAEALQAVAAYKEFPYAIRRRNPDDPAAERVRLSTAMSDVQAKLSYYVAWTAGESDAVGRAYSELVAEVRRVAGGACHDAWLANPVATDAEMNIGFSKVELSAIKPLEERYVAVAHSHLSDFLSIRRLFRLRH